MSERDEDGDEFAEGIEIEQAPEAADETLAGDVVEEGEPEADEPEKAEDEGGEDEPEKGKRRSKPASERIAEITRDKHEAIRRAEAAEAELNRLRSGEQVPGGKIAPELTEPNPEEFEFGEADPAYLKALAKYEVRVELAAERQAQAAEAQDAAAKARADELNAAWAEKAEKAAEKYPDFQETVIASAAAKEWPLLPLSSAAVASSENGEDIAYHLATNRDDANKLAELEMEFHQARDMAQQAGLNDQLTILMVKPYLDRATDFYTGIEAKVKSAVANDTKPQGNRVTSAPEPASERTRGAGGRFTPDYASENVDLDDVMKALKSR